MNTLPVLGLDVGGVLVDRAAQGADTSFFGDRPMDTPIVAGAAAGVLALVGHFESRVYIVSKGSRETPDLTRRWLGRKGLIGVGRIPGGNIHFVRKRNEKAAICEALGITHFVDDRLDVLDSLDTVPYRYLFTGGLGGNGRPVHVPERMIVVDDWPKLCERIVGDSSTDPVGRA